MKPFLNLILFCIVLISNPLFAFAQEIFVEVKSTFNGTIPKFEGSEAMKNNTKGRGEIVFNTSLGLSGQLYKFIFLKTTVGSNDFNHLNKTRVGTRKWQ